MPSAQLPVLPARADVLSVGAVEQIEHDVAERIAQVEAVEVLEEWRARAAALAEYLRGRELQAPMLGAQRRIEARIGQLLGEPIVGSHHSIAREGREVGRQDRVAFRTLALALEHELLSDDEWRQSRRALVNLVRERSPLPAKAGVADADVQARGRVRSAFVQHLQRLDADTAWLAANVGKAVEIASSREIDRWEIATEHALQRLSEVARALTKGEA